MTPPLRSGTLQVDSHAPGSLPGRSPTSAEPLDVDVNLRPTNEEST